MGAVAAGLFILRHGNVTVLGLPVVLIGAQNIFVAPARCDNGVKLPGMLFLAGGGVRSIFFVIHSQIRPFLIKDTGMFRIVSAHPLKH